jgi:hypothetical protein
MATSLYFCANRGSLVLVMILVAIGAVGYAGLAFVAKPMLILLFATLAFGGGWGWVGLFLLAVRIRSPPVPLSASSTPA